MSRRLKEFQVLLKAQRKFLDAIVLAEESGCSVPTVYRWVRVLRAKGATVAEERVPHSKTGPTPTKFKLIKQADL